MLKIKRLRPSAQIPSYATPGSAGLDLCADLDAPVTLEPGGAATIPTGLAVQLEPGRAGFIFARSGLGVRYGIVPSNCVGVIDSDYRGELQVGLTNLSDTPFTIENHMRIAQLVISECVQAVFVETENLDETARGAGGFGSTGLHAEKEA